MRSTFIAITAVLCATTSVLAVPAETGLHSSLTFDVNRIANPEYSGPSGVLTMAKTYSKFGKPLSPGLKNAMTNQFPDWGSVPAVSSGVTYDEYYLEPIAIGTPPQNLTLNFDTGSADLWVFSAEVPAEFLNGQKLYSPNTSSTATYGKNFSWEISYGDGSSTYGDVWFDKVCLGDACFAHQTVETAQYVSPSFTKSSDTDGFLGLGFSTLNSVYPKVHTWFDNMKWALIEPLFTVNLKHKKPGSYNFGYIDLHQFSGSVGWAYVNPNLGYWLFNITAFGIGKETNTSEDLATIADTGTTLLYLPDHVCNAYYSAIPGGHLDEFKVGGYVFPCNATLPDFAFGISYGYTGVIPGNYMNYSTSGWKDGNCIGGLQSSNWIGLNIAGDILLKSQFVIFDGGDPLRVGFAAKHTGRN